MATTTASVSARSSTLAARSVLGAVARYSVLLVVAAAIVVPIAYAALAGFRTSGEMYNDPAGLPASWVPSNYIEILTGSAFWIELFNSTVIALITTVVAVGAAALAAFVFARMAFRGREVLYTVFVLGLLFPIAVAILPLYLMIRGLGLLDNPLGVALPQAAFALPLAIVILRPFFQSIPMELEDAARIDGCGQFGFFWRVLLPLSRPALATVGILVLVTSWNAFLLPLIVLSGAEQWTLPLGVMNFSAQFNLDVARVLAFTTLAMIPALAFYALAERQIIGGLTAGSVKG